MCAILIIYLIKLLKLKVVWKSIAYSILLCILKSACTSCTNVKEEIRVINL